MTVTVLAAAFAIALGAPQPAAPKDAVERRREAIARELVRVGGELQHAIERGDSAAILARVPDDGLRCAGRVVPKAKVARDLRGPQTWLHGVLFGRTDVATQGGAPESLAALFRSAREIAVLVSFQPDPRAGPVGRPCVDFRAKGQPTPGAPFCFEERGGRWWLTESLYPCG